jgi:hypothetical protein
MSDDPGEGSGVVGEIGERRRRVAIFRAIRGDEGGARGGIGRGIPGALESGPGARRRLRPEGWAEQANGGRIDIVIGQQGGEFRELFPGIGEQHGIEGRRRDRLLCEVVCGLAIALGAGLADLFLDRAAAIGVIGDLAHQGVHRGHAGAVEMDPRRRKTGLGAGPLQRLRHEMAIAAFGQEGDEA